MIIMAYSAYTAASIGEGLGAPEYSYWFVRRAFAPVLAQFGIVVPVTDPGREVDQICASAAAQGQDCVFFSFEPPHKTALGLSCRTIAVFAWEFDSIPDESWDDEPRNDWRVVLSAAGSAITHSSFSARAIRRTMGQDYPVWCIPAPVYDAHAGLAESARPIQPPTMLALSGIAIDTGQLDADMFSLSRGFSDGLDSLRALARYLETPDRPRQMLELSGVVYTAIFNPIDGRKNFNDVLGAFIWAFRDIADATLLLKITHHDVVRGMQPVLADIAKHGRFRCRVVLIHGMLPDDEYNALVRTSSYTVNASTNEGQCLPLMEFMSAGRPAIAPAHSSMSDYVNDANSFVVRYAAKPFIWPHDSRQAIRTHRYLISFADLVRAYRESYHVARHDPGRYAAMSRAARAALRDFCSVDMAVRRVAEVLAHSPCDSAAARAEPAGRDIMFEDR
jgi:glycosyltransferase involved in cell wall biosynthesis